VRRKIAVAILIAVAIPIPQTTTAPWTAQVVDESGKPQPAVTVRQVWQNYTLESAPHNDTRATDSSGQVIFPRRILWRPLVLNAVGTIRNRLHGPVAYLEISADRFQSLSDHCCTSRLILHPPPEPRTQ
jgi:hypothetical protein